MGEHRHDWTKFSDILGEVTGSIGPGCKFDYINAQNMDFGKLGSIVIMGTMEVMGSAIW